MTDGDLPVVSPPFDAADAGEVGAPGVTNRDDAPRVAGVVLAAGTSSRFGERNKLVAPAGNDDGEPLVRAAARTLLEAGLAPVVAVVGHEADRVVDALDGLDVRTVRNDEFESGQASSVRAGIDAVAAAEPPVDAAVVALGDMPFVDPATVRTLVDAYAAGVGGALAPAHEGRRGNPVLFDRRFFEPLTDVDGDVGGRAVLLGSDDSALVAVDDPGVRRDVDEPTDL